MMPPSTTETAFPIVGLGASAGGLAAFEAFFAALPKTGAPAMAFVVVQHLAPDHETLLPALLQRHTALQVTAATNGQRVEPNCVYTIPPNCELQLAAGVLLVEPAKLPHGHRTPIDHFFSSLAQDQGEASICIILAGTGSDGTAGLRAVKRAGGRVFVQSPEGLEYDGMPRSAIATGLVDFILRPEEMAAQLLRCVSNDQEAPAGEAVISPLTTANLERIFQLLRQQTQHDFSQYKPNTIQRRIARRMVVQRLSSLQDYANFLQGSPSEVDALFRDLLIGVTSFFRDPEAFELLREKVVPQIVANRADSGVIRVWSAGCSTGEEAYSLAILFAENPEVVRLGLKVSVFATDIDAQAVATARAGVYPASVAADISPARLTRFFAAQPDGSGYRVNKGLRDLLVFSEQDLIKDPPFSRLDLVCCRNLLIYLGTDLQKRLLPLFRYALNPGGVLFLGISETVGEHPELFAPIDRKLKLFSRREFAVGTRRHLLDGYVPPGSSPTDLSARQRLPRPVVPRPSLREAAEQALLRHSALSGALITEQGDLLYVHGRTGQYLEPAPGDVGISNILKMAREGLRLDLSTAIHQATNEQRWVTKGSIPLTIHGQTFTFDLSVGPVRDDSAPTEAPLYLVIFADRAPRLPPDSPLSSLEGIGSESAPASGSPLALLQRELRAKEEYLQSAAEELETTNDQLRSSNEELQSVNEELQSTNEELETSKEELQSLNEELSTVNAELQSKVFELSRSNNDLNNLMAGTGIGTLFVDHKLRIVRFTPATTRIINLIASDVGRPVGHIVSNLVAYDQLLADTQRVLDTLVPSETEVQTQTGAWYTLRILPYRTLENVIEGAVITFVDISEARRTRDALRASDACFRQLAESLAQMVWTCGPTGHCDYLSPAWLAFTGVPEAQQLGFGWLQQIHPEDRSMLTSLWEQAIPTKETTTVALRIRSHDGSHRWFQTQANALLGDTGNILRWFGATTPVAPVAATPLSPSSAQA